MFGGGRIVGAAISRGPCSELARKTELERSHQRSEEVIVIGEIECATFADASTSSASKKTRL